MNKPTIAAIGAFVLLLVAFVATRETSVSVGVQKFDVPALTSAAIESVSVTGANTALLERGASGWTVADPAKADAKFAADEPQVQALLTALAEFRGGDFISDKADKHGEYELTDKGTTVTVKAGSTTFAFVLGKSSKNGGTYLRKADGAAVFSTPSQVGWQVKRNVTAWRNKSITTAPIADVQQVEVSRADGQAFTLKQVEGGSFELASAAPSGFRFDGSAGQRLVSQLTTLQAQDFLTADGDFSKAHTFTLTLKDGKSVKVTLGAKKEDGTAPLKVDGVAQQYVVASWVSEQLDKELDDLRDLRLVDFDVAKATRLSIVVDGKKTVVAKDGETWKFVEPKAAPAGVEFEPSQVSVQLNRLKSARAARLTDATAAKAGLAKPSAVIEATVDGKPVRLVFGGDAGNNEVFVQGGLDAAVYAVAVGEKASWSAGPSLFNKPAPPPNLGQMNGLDQLPPEIREKLMKQLQMQQRN